MDKWILRGPQGKAHVTGGVCQRIRLVIVLETHFRWMEVLFRGRRTRAVMFYFLLITVLDIYIYFPPRSVCLSPRRRRWAERRSRRSGWLPRVNTRGWLAPATLQVTRFYLISTSCERLTAACGLQRFHPPERWCVGETGAPALALAGPARWLLLGYPGVCGIPLLFADVPNRCLLSPVSELKTLIFLFISLQHPRNKIRKLRYSSSCSHSICG